MYITAISMIILHLILHSAVHIILYDFHTFTTSIILWSTLEANFTAFYPKLILQPHTEGEFVKRAYAEISQHVVTLFVGLCHLHQQQKSVTDHLKRPITKPIQVNNFLAHVQLDLIHFRNLNCSCGKNHNWLLYATDHYST